MRLRTIGLISILVLGLLVGPLPAEAQQSAKVPRIGYLLPRSAVPKEFRQGLRELGYIEGKNIIFEPRFAEGKFDRFPRFAAELVRLKVDVIVTWSTPAARAAKKATTTIPIVMLARGDPVRRGLVASLARPGGNITGMTSQTDSPLFAKHLELLKEVVPNLLLVAVLLDPRHSGSSRSLKATEHVAGLLGLKIQSLEVRGPDDLESAFQVATKAGAQGLITFRHAPILRGRKRIVALAIKSRLPAIYGDKIFVKAGGLMSYGPDQADLYRRQATYVDKILKGANPANLPVEQPKKFELLINLKTANQIGLTIPPEFLFRAHKVIK
jgi:putative ABC transport system substrate-binding protein